LRSSTLSIISNAACLTVTNSTFAENNGGDQSGAIYHNGLANSAASTTINDSTFTGNLADREGGALFVNGNTTITQSTFTENRADNAGGAIYAANNANLTVIDSTLSQNIALADRTDNIAGIGGAIALASATLNWQNSTINNNTVKDEDSGIFSTNTILNITGSTIQRHFTANLSQV
jgi:predicted outer membrane repeat protein